MQLNRYSANWGLKAAFSLGSSEIAEGRCMVAGSLLLLQWNPARLSAPMRDSLCLPIAHILHGLSLQRVSPPPFTRGGFVQEETDALIKSSVSIFTNLICGIKAITQQNKVSQHFRVLDSDQRNWYTQESWSQWERWNIQPLLQGVN